MPNQFAIMRFRKLKTKATCKSAIDHIDRKTRAPFENSKIKNPKFDVGERPAKYMDFVKSHLAEGQKIRKDNVLALEFVLTFSPNAIRYDKDTLVDWARENMGWLCENFGGRENVYKLDLHLHESTPHIHAIVTPAYQGKLNCKHFIGNREQMRTLQDSYAEKMSRFGLERGISRDITRKYHKDVRTWQQEQIRNIDKRNEQLDKKEEELERVSMTLQEQKEILDAVHNLMQEDFDFRIQVNAKMGQLAMPEPELLPQKKKSKNLDLDELERSL